ncbi:MAG: right-handed parallel beta-helix repeat-containing protein, partial [Promethearchaeota archaeon]
MKKTELFVGLIILSGVWGWLVGSAFQMNVGDFKADKSMVKPKSLLVAEQSTVITTHEKYNPATDQEKKSLPQQSEYLNRVSSVCRSTFVTSYVEHAPIYIDENGDFTSHGFSGSGTLNDPYRIEGLNITASNGDLISISDTTAYFRIKDNFLNGLNGEHSGIFLTNIINGKIENNLIYNNGFDGIFLDNSKNNAFINNTIHNNTGCGIFHYLSNDNIIENNTIYNNEAAGIFLEDSDNYEIIHNVN